MMIEESVNGVKSVEGSASVQQGVLSVTGIVVVNTLGAISAGGTLLFTIPEDMQFFKRETTGHTVVMGSRTFKSIGYTPLSKRNNIVLSSTSPESGGTYNEEYVIKTSSVERVLQLAQHYYIEKKSNLYVIGGALTYKTFIPYINKWLVTHVDNEDLGDTYFPYVCTRAFKEAFPVVNVLMSYDSDYGAVIVKEYLPANNETRAEYTESAEPVSRSIVSNNIDTSGIDESDDKEYLQDNRSVLC